MLSYQSDQMAEHETKGSSFLAHPHPHPTHFRTTSLFLPVLAGMLDAVPLPLPPHLPSLGSHYGSC